MPKEVDHDQRRNELADAVLRIVARGGVGSVTLREAAMEAGWSTGALNHYFDGKHDMLEGALRRAMQLIARQIREAQDIADPREALERMLSSVLPFDDTRLGFARVWLSFCGEAIAMDDIRTYLAKSDAAWRQNLAAVIRRGQGTQQFAANLDPEWIADTLGALIDGMSTRTVIQNTGLTPRAAKQTARGWVSALVPPPAAASPAVTSTAVTSTAEPAAAPTAS
jgi:AcrR family transcriptional regulator